MTGSEVGEKERGGIGKSPRAVIRTQDGHNVTALYVDALHTRLCHAPGRSVCVFFSPCAPRDLVFPPV